MIIDKSPPPGEPSIVQTMGRPPIHPQALAQRQSSGSSRSPILDSAPPPYSIPRASPSFGHSRIASSTQCTNHLSISTRHDPITGTFLLDPSLCIPGQCPESSKKKGHKSRRKNKHGWSPNDAKHLNAKFETRKGHMTLDLGVVGQPGPVSKAAVEVRSGKGGADINVIQINENRQLSLDVSTGRGHIFIFIPTTYRGPINVHSRSGVISFLPHLASTMSLISGGPHETLAVLGNIDPHLYGSGPIDGHWQGDYLHLSSGSGNITIGLYDRDKKPVEQGWWKKLTEFFFDSKSLPFHES